MAPKLRVLAGTSPESMVIISSLVNTNKPHTISSDLFNGEIVTHIKNFIDENDNIRESEYFKRDDRQGITWSIQVRGRFLKPYNANDILFGNTFDRPLKLPWGTGAVLKFMNYIDPTLEHDLQSSTKPWALSPLISTMPYFKHRRAEDTSESLIDGRPTSPFPATQSLVDSTPDLYKANEDLDSSSNTHTHTLTNIQLEDAYARRAYFNDPKNRQAVVFGPMDVITTDFCYGFIEFSPSLSLSIGGGVSFDLTRYWDGQPVRCVCCERKVDVQHDEDDGNPWGRIFWCVAIEMCDEDQDGSGSEESQDDID